MYPESSTGMPGFRFLTDTTDLKIHRENIGLSGMRKKQHILEVTPSVGQKNVANCHQCDQIYEAKIALTFVQWCHTD